ncbi:hypothetical protein TSUD_51740 [Trifolium subterraneum]|uniref:Uncharacterized protein n=1 Tax=Trifolium subterraneum TaxID=3900 RepID=A0A2Z6M7C2_TRISU|nr:hypothetical protein TSUD_51740 [Trifolium subterraneum]
MDAANDDGEVKGDDVAETEQATAFDDNVAQAMNAVTETASLNNGDDVVVVAAEESVPDGEKQAMASLTEDERAVEVDDVAAGTSSFGKKRGRKRKTVNEAEIAKTGNEVQQVNKKRKCMEQIVPKEMKHTAKSETNKDEEVEFNKYLLKGLLPYLRQLDEEQMIEKATEAKRQGLSLSKLQIKSADYSKDERVYWLGLI